MFIQKLSDLSLHIRTLGAAQAYTAFRKAWSDAPKSYREELAAATVLQRFVSVTSATKCP